MVIGTSGTQRFIFESTKRRENVGASHLVTRIEETWLDDALLQLEASRTSRIRTGPVEIVTANAGGITALVRDPGLGRTLVAAITGRALRDAPGLDVCGVVGPAFDWDGANVLADALHRARAKLPTVRLAHPGPQARFPGLPIAAQCTSSGLPAQSIIRPAPGEESQPRSAAGVAKLEVFEPALVRLAEKMGPLRGEANRTRAGLRTVVEHLGERADWVAVVHVDGNGLGRVFQNLPSVMRSQGRTTAEEYADGLRDLSQGVDECVEKAFRTTVAEFETSGESLVDGHLPLLPLVLGGDDLTVICDGAVALSFTERYLTLFKECAQNDERVGSLLRQAGEPALGACAGVAIVKRQYPFRSAVALAEALTQEAKSVKVKLGPDRCALSFHVLYESAAADLARLRGGTTLADGTRLTAQPYVVGDPGPDPEGWSRHRRWNDLRRRVRALSRTNADGDRVLAGGQAHDLRSGLFVGKDVADSRFSLLTTRLGGVVTDLVAEERSLFWTYDGVAYTGLLDAMDAVGFLAGEGGE
ncbi:Cas10/Cmr2 second palm domain-containing protein [Nonomuraea bangladeshensis]